MPGDTPKVKSVSQTIYDKRVSVEMTEAQWYAYKYYAYYYNISQIHDPLSHKRALAAQRLGQSIEPDSEFWFDENQDKL